jgi:peptidoglycan DL-endopeptidase CwlO
VHTAPSVRRIVRQRVAALTVMVFAAGLLLGVTASAGAAPMPSVSQVQAKLKRLQTQVDKLDQQYDQVKQQWLTTKQRLQLIDREIAVDSRKFAGLQAEIGRIGITQYEDGNLNSSIAMLTSGNAQQILDKSSILLALSDANGWQIADFLAATRQLTNAQLQARRTNAGLTELKNGLAKRRRELSTLVSNETTLLNQLSPAEQIGLGPGGNGQTGGLKYTGATSTQAEKAVKFAYGAVGCPYLYGGTSCSPGYDCSGLTMSAWASAGVSIPRTSYDQESSLPQVDLAPGDPTKYLQPGDILGFAGNSHVGIYVGGGELIDAPHTGASVELIKLQGWYSQELDEAVRP